MPHDIQSIFAFPAIAVILCLALAFDFTNGFHDAANSVATIVGTKVLKPWQAVVWAAFWNFAAAWFFGIAVANTVAKWIDIRFVTPQVIAAGLVGAIAWNLITWRKGLPSSSSHALLGGFAGAAIACAGRLSDVVKMDKALLIIAFIFISPIAGMVMSYLLARAVRTCSPPDGKNESGKAARGIQLVSSAAYSLGHGTNDAQKTMGIVAALLYASVWKADQAAFAAGHVAFPFWIVIVCHLALALGTLAGGWKIVDTLANKVTSDLKPRGGACAETAAAAALFGAANLGIPVSTTHAITGSLVGIGLENHPDSVIHGRKIVEIGTAWFLTIPAAGLIAAAAYGTISLFI